ncbi:hypothetical protein [Gordonibacter sp. 28C]|uniref:hypothetical protein n=1 Tax=Gordonibacter sp. 28C TaxID=2078569 RepID=UPI001314CDBA|nr:hypothetical protein [Gordonibacter sp. 28C]
MDEAGKPRVFARKRVIGEVSVRDMDHERSLLIGIDDRAYREVETNIWAAGEVPDVLYLGTGRHGGGIVLRPLYVLADGTWLNVSTGRTAPFDTLPAV